MASYETYVTFRGLKAEIIPDRDGDILTIRMPTVDIPKPIIVELKELELRESQIEEVCETIRGLTMTNYLLHHRVRE